MTRASYLSHLMRPAPGPLIQLQGPAEVVQRVGQGLVGQLGLAAVHREQTQDGERTGAVPFVAARGYNQTSPAT